MLFGSFFDNLKSKLKRRRQLPRDLCANLFYANDVVFNIVCLSASVPQQLLNSMQGFCAANGQTISTPKWNIVFGGSS